MSSLPGYTMESWLEEEYWLKVLDDELDIAIWPGRLIRVNSTQFKELVDLFEEHREYIEDKLLDFDEENQSWRAYNSAVFMNYFPDELEVKARDLVESWANLNKATQ